MRLSLRSGRARTALATMCIVAGSLISAGTARATLPGSNGLIAFQREHDTNSQIATIEQDGSNVIELTSGPGYAVTPAWSPDGSRIAFTRGDDLLVVGVGGGVETVLLSACADGRPIWSPDGTRIAFVNGCNSEISVVNADGTGVISDLTSTTGVFNIPSSWSSDGSRIAFTRWSIGTYQDVWLLNVDGSGEVDLTNTPSRGEAAPDFSPDDSMLAFGVGDGDIYVMPVAGSTSPQNLTNTAGLIEGSPVWSPEGDLIAYEATDLAYDDVDIYVMGSDGTGPINITNRPEGDDRWPKWQTAPVPAPNDDIGNATPITALPFTDGPLDTSEATTSVRPADPSCWGRGHTAWYSVTLPSDTVLEVNTRGSGYDTTLSVYTRTGNGGLTQLDCRDDDYGRQSRVRFHAAAGTTYLLMVGAYNDTPGGVLMMNAFATELAVDLSITGGTVDPASGTARVSGVVRCSRDVQVEFVTGTLLQRIGGRAAFEASFSADPFPCTPPQADWTSNPIVSPGPSFMPGNAAVQGASTWVCLVNECDGAFLATAQTIKLRRT